MVITVATTTTAYPIDIPEGVRAHRDMAYVEGGHERQRLDLYLPENSSGPTPVVVWVHGGGWAGGSKNNTPALWLVSKGFAVASINYRLSQHAIFPAQIHDCKAAVRWLRAHATEHNLDAKHIGAWGSSAGGHLVALMATTRSDADLEGTLGNPLHSSEVQAVVDWFGPTDFLTVGAKETRTNLLGGDPQLHPDKAKRASPMNYLSKQAAPLLIMHGDKDKTVPISQSETFAAALKALGADAEFVRVPDGGHGGSQFSTPENRKRIQDFFSRHLFPQLSAD